MKRILLSGVAAAVALVAIGAGIRVVREKGRHAVSVDAPMNPGGMAATQRGDVTIDTRRQQLIGVRTAPATRVVLTSSIRAAASVRSAETRLSDINVKLDGWIRELYVDYTGQAVSKGQPLFSFYSPDLLTTENEYLLALTTRDQLQQSQIADARERADQLVASARQRLALWDLPEDDLRALDERRQPRGVVTFRSPTGGVVMEKTAIQGMHVAAGQMLYKIADLSVVWVEADVYERELPLVRVGGRATVTLDAYPGERFDGRVVYIYPYVDEKTRTNKVRYELANRGGRLKPGMFAAVDMTTAGGSGITVPSDAVLDSGAEQLVFIAKGDGVFEPRNVKVGRRLGDRTQILEGVTEGEQVAMGATFFLDSESQLRASLQGYEAASQLDIVFRAVPDPPRVGDNRFEVVVKDARGTPIADADVSVQFFMAAMPAMSMPAIRNEVKLAPAGNGLYRGTGQVLASGQWDTTIAVARGGQRLGSRRLAMVSR